MLCIKEGVMDDMWTDLFGIFLNNQEMTMVLTGTLGAEIFETDEKASGSSHVRKARRL